MERKERAVLLKHNGHNCCQAVLCTFSEELGISANTLYGRIYHLGWTVEKAFTTPGRATK